MKGADKKRIQQLIRGAYALVGKDAQISTIGWCFGGGWSLQAAIMAGDKARKCVIYCGMPEKDEERLKKLSCPVLGKWAEQDGWITPKVVQNFEGQMRELGKSVQSYSYPEKHAFANPSNPQYSENSTRDAWQKTIEFLRL
jgi:carboxymethylenebutenolidase